MARGLERLEGAVIMVTGASAGIGRAVALRLAEDGARIGLMARDAQALEEVARAVRSRGGDALVLPCDVADADGVFRATDELERAFGPLDAWINDAMVTVFAPVHETSPEEYRRVTEVTYLGTVHGTLAALRSMRRSGRGVICQVGSALAYRGIPLQSAYCAAKHAIVGFSDSLRAELVHDDLPIAITEVHLPAVDTPQFDWSRSKMPRPPRPSGPVYTPQAAADAIVRSLYAPKRSYWLGGVTATTILGNSLLPGVADRYLGRNAVDGQMRPGGRGERSGNLYQPVHGLHATSGSFSDEASGSATMIPGPEARIGHALLAGLAAAGLGLALAQATRTRR